MHKKSKQNIDRIDVDKGTVMLWSTTVKEALDVDLYDEVSLAFPLGSLFLNTPAQLVITQLNRFDTK